MRSKAGGLLVALFLAACSPRQARPNVVLVMADTLRADYLGCYGFEGEVSPNLDRLAGEALLFEACISQAPWTKPAVASLFTSLHPQTHGVVTHDGMFAERGAEMPARLETDVLPDAALTLAELMAAGGYVTQAFVTNPWIRREHGFDQGFAGFEQSLPVERSTQEVFEAAMDWVEEEREAPFFLYLHLMEVHGPYDSPESDARAVAGAAGLGPSRALTARDQRRLPEYLRLADWTRAAGAGDLRTWRQRYAAGVHAFDRHLGSFVETLRETRRLKNTLLVVTSDHGEELLEHGNWDHGGSLHDHQLHVPLLIRPPGDTRSGRSVSSPMELVDLSPTILGLCGLPAPEGQQGLDRSAWLASPPTSSGAALSTGVKWKPGLVSLRTETHRLIAGGEGGAQLFDLRTDPTEQTDLAAEQPELVRQLSALLLGRLEELESVEPLAGERAAVSEDLRGKLEDLGYF